MAVPKVTGFRANGRRVQAQKAQILLRSEFVTFLSDFSRHASCLFSASLRARKRKATNSQDGKRGSWWSRSCRRAAERWAPVSSSSPDRKAQNIMVTETVNGP